MLVLQQTVSPLERFEPVDEFHVEPLDNLCLSLYKTVETKCQHQSGEAMRVKHQIGVRRAISAAGGLSSLARLLKITPQSIQKWKRIPRRRIVQVEQVTKVPREKLAPDIFKR